MAQPTPASIAASVATLQAQVAALQTSLPTPQYPIYSMSTDGKSLVATRAGIVLAIIKLPYGMRFTGRYVVGYTYSAGMLFVYSGQPYYVINTFTATNGYSDTTSANVGLIIARPGNGLKIRGQYNSANTYFVGDCVSLAGAPSTFYCLVSIPTTGSLPAPAIGGSNWAVAFLSWPFPDSMVYDNAQNKTLDQIIASMYSSIAATTSALNAAMPKDIFFQFYGQASTWNTKYPSQQIDYVCDRAITLTGNVFAFASVSPGEYMQLIILQNGNPVGVIQFYSTNTVPQTVYFSGFTTSPGDVISLSWSSSKSFTVSVYGTPVAYAGSLGSSPSSNTLLGLGVSLKGTTAG